MTGQVYCISGIDTDIGKTYATAWLMQYWQQQGKRVITQKWVQTGCDSLAEDIITHRRLCQMPLTEEDKLGWTMPYVLPYPASPHFSAQLANTVIDVDKITASTQYLQQRYDMILAEGSGGLMVPLTQNMLMLDYIAQQHYPVILVTCGRLGSINHTLLSLEVLKSQHITLTGLVYNTFFDANNMDIATNTQHFLRQHLIQYYPESEFWVLPSQQ